MNWKDYFEKTSGKGLLATAGRTGEVDIAIYSRPHVMEDGTLAFGMTDRLTHANLGENPYAVYAFNEKGYKGGAPVPGKGEGGDGGFPSRGNSQTCSRGSVPGNR